VSFIIKNIFNQVVESQQDLFGQFQIIDSERLLVRVVMEGSSFFLLFQALQLGNKSRNLTVINFLSFIRY